MKKHKIKMLLIGASSIILINNTNAQSTNGTGGNGFVAGRVLGFTGNGASPLLFKSNGADKMMLNGNVNNSINGGPVLNREGFLGLGVPTGFFPTSAGQGPFSLLHLNGQNTLNLPQTAGYRNWMQYGITSTHNQDLMFIGQRSTAGSDVTDAVIGWADNAFPGAGPDNMVFDFLTGAQGGSDDLTGTASFGREVMRLTAFGNVGIGPRFNNAAQPQSQLHINGENSVPTYMVVTNQSTTGQTFNDGFHFGITGTGIAEVKQRENQDMRFYTNDIQQAVIKNTGWIGFNTNTPGNELEITSRAATPYGLAGSGLRFTNMTSAATPIANPGTGVLSVDVNGDVIYVPGGGVASANNGVSVSGGALQLGVPCTLPSGFPNVPGILASQLTTDRIVANRNQNFWIASSNAETGGVGIGGQPVLPFCGTGNTFEVSANSKNPQYGSTNASGMRFTKLTASSPTIPNGTNGVNSAKVLTVDGDGDVVLTNASVGTSLGNVCAATTQNLLTNNWEIPTNNFNFRFIAPTGTNAYGKNYVGIGTSCAPTANFDVFSPLTSNNPNAVTAINCSQTNLANNSNYSGLAIGIASDVNAQNKNNIGVGANARNAQYNYGFYGTANAVNSGTSNQRNVGVYAEASKAPQNFAMRGRAVSNTGIASGLTIGGWFSAENSQTRVGVMGDINGSQFGIPTLFPYNNAIGVYGWNPSPGATEYAGYFEGKVNVNGALTVYGVAVPSDATLKTNIDSITNASAILKQIEAKSFYFDTMNVNGMKFSSQKQYGVIAQQVETVLPELINNNYKPAMVDSAGTIIYPAKSFKTVNYTAFIGLLIKANQEQQTKIDSLTTKLNSKDSIQDARLTALENAITQCCSNANTRTSSNSNLTTNNSLDIELSDKDAIVLNQNVPNPFAEQTTITYNVPASVGKAQLIFFNTNGQVIQTVDIKTRGKGKVNVFASDLSSGLYNYSLIADGKVIDSKKMVRE